MGSPEKPIDVEMGDMDETNQLNPQIKVEDGNEKVEEEEVRFTGLKKDELMEISSQRQWVVARWILFILFWLGWIGMLVGAIVIVVQAPRCKKEPTPPWHQDTVVYRADVRKFADNLEGMTKHVDYVKSINAKTLTVCHANDPQDPAKVINNGSAQFKELVTAAHGKGDEIELKVVVDLQIDVLSVSSQKFIESAIKNCSGSSTTPGCNLFVWKANDSVTDDGTGVWKYHPEREEKYKVSTSDNDLAFLNYESIDAKDYLKELLKQWMGYGADGFQLRDLKNVKNAAEIVQLARNTVEATKEEEEDMPVIGLFLISSATAIEDQVALFGNDQNDTEVPVVINSQWSSPLPDSNVGQQLQRNIETWMNESYPFTGAYAVNTMDMSPLIERLGENKTAGLTLLSMTLPGVPVIKAGDEALLSDDFTWDVEGSKNINPLNGSSSNIKMVKDVADMRVSQFRALQSLRWNNEHAKFNFLETNSTDVIAFTRVWDTKPTLLVVSNLSAKNVTVVVTPKPDQTSGAKVLISSNPVQGKTEYSLNSMRLESGLTLLLQMDKKE